MPAGGLFSTASDLSCFYQMLLNKGQWKGKQILSESAVRALTQRQTPKGLPESYGLGFSVGETHFGHGGAYSTNTSADTKSGLIFVWLVQHAGFPGEGAKSQDAFLKKATDIFAPSGN
jgi:CubicO group peptidase (beta-lactamase class C family)